MSTKYHFTDGGLRNVWLKNGFEIKETPYGRAVSIHDMDGLVKTLCTAFVRKKSKLTGAEFRYIRTAMLLSQGSLGKAFGKTDQSIANWEKSGKIPLYADTLIRVLWVHHYNGDEKVKNILHAMNDTERVIFLAKNQASKGWSSEEIDEEELSAA